MNCYMCKLNDHSLHFDTLNDLKYEFDDLIKLPNNQIEDKKE